jgi:methyl-accepting chemotaxis protein
MDHASGLIEKSFIDVTSLAEQNKNGIAEISRGVKDISSALAELSGLGGQNSENLVQLNEVINRFKTVEV